MRLKRRQGRPANAKSRKFLHAVRYSAAGSGTRGKKKIPPHAGQLTHLALPHIDAPWYRRQLALQLFASASIVAPPRRIPQNPRRSPLRKVGGPRFPAQLVHCCRPLCSPSFRPRPSPLLFVTSKDPCRRKIRAEARALPLALGRTSQT